MKQLGYREMLRDRCPKVVDYALKWQKAKDKWVEHTYCHFIKIIGNKYDTQNKLIQKAPAVKKEIAYAILGIVKGKPKNFIFDKSIDWDNLTDEECKYWKRISSWVTWFGKEYSYIQNEYEISKQAGKDDMTIRVNIINNYLSALMPTDNASEEEKQAKYKYIDRFVEYLIKCFEKEYV